MGLYGEGYVRQELYEMGGYIGKKVDVRRGIHDDKRDVLLSFEKCRHRFANANADAIGRPTEYSLSPVMRVVFVHVWPSWDRTTD